MAITALNPYLFFDGDAEEAIRHYERALGAKTEGLMRYADMPGNTPAPENRDRVMHAMLRVDAGVFMVSDREAGRPSPGGSNVDVVLALDDADDMARKFDALAEGGKVTMPIHDAFWGDRFGALTDAYGITWMFTCPIRKG